MNFQDRTVLNVGRLPATLLDRLRQHFTLVDAQRPEDRAALLARHGAQVQALVTSAASGAEAALLDQLPALQVISSFGVGLDKVPVAAAHARHIPVGYTPDVLNDCVADHAFALLLACARRTAEADRWMRAGHWPQSTGPFPLGRKVSGARLGLLGLGRIGQTIARRASGFDMTVRYHSRRPVAGVPWAHEPQLLALADWADYLVVITSGGPQTRHLVDTPVLQALGPQGFLINVARGSVVDEAALVSALTQGTLGGAGLDVFEREPAGNPALHTLERVVLTPHIASATQETRQAMADRVVENLLGYFGQGRLVTEVARG
ncbi:2-hydroxyacid dehydrogenase [Ideonella livida]|uniref:2-hydroxyacid dehydrogenase n=1 Tax=Ideonella livida TaxID=2707176 RepID=A0A7C9PFK3_9BURK|nr:2-hydroxyacid dehydrogenase [Ideonella livida]NDY90448.1 2-hydroxyacid dehydrogenase [Ideonella livida]